MKTDTLVPKPITFYSSLQTKFKKEEGKFVFDNQQKQQNLKKKKILKLSMKKLRSYFREKKNILRKGRLFTVDNSIFLC